VNGVKAIRCGIYTRKSTEEGLDQEFNSLHAQREPAEAYITSQKEAGWKLLVDHYDDGGFSGGNLDRPALQRLLADIEARRLDCVVVYKVDRLSRSLIPRLLDGRCDPRIAVAQGCDADCQRSPQQRFCPLVRPLTHQNLRFIVQTCRYVRMVRPKDPRPQR
jgi:hypothetical protein